MAGSRTGLALLFPWRRAPHQRSGRAELKRLIPSVVHRELDENLLRLRRQRDKSLGAMNKEAGTDVVGETDGTKSERRGLVKSNDYCAAVAVARAKNLAFLDADEHVRARPGTTHSQAT